MERESRVGVVLAGIECKSEEIRVDSLEAVQKLAEKRGNEHGVLVFIYAVDGVHHAKEIADALGDLKKNNDWHVNNLGVVEALSTLYGPLFLSVGTLGIILRHRHDNGITAVLKQARQLIRQGRKLKTMELGGITGTVFGQNQQESVPQGGRAMGDRIINLCNQVIGDDAEHLTKRNKPVSDEWFDKADKLRKDIEMFVTQPVHLPMDPDAASGRDERLPAAAADDDHLPPLPALLRNKRSASPAAAAEAEGEHLLAASGSASDHEESLPRRRRRRRLSPNLPAVPDVTPK
uniref:Uncharacterized protein n=1 Tax=Oryza meridionalis TaxID=40149 RepID=A0A0E0DU64_9ORYZ